MRKRPKLAWGAGKEHTRMGQTRCNSVSALQCTFSHSLPQLPCKAGIGVPSFLIKRPRLGGRALLEISLAVGC